MTVCEALKAAAERFREYERHHAAKPDAEKAARNAEMAEMCELALAKHSLEIHEAELRGLGWATQTIDYNEIWDLYRREDAELARRRRGIAPPIRGEE